MHPYPGNWVAIGRAVVYHARGDQAFSAGIKCRHCAHVKAIRVEFACLKTITPACVLVNLLTWCLRNRPIPRNMTLYIDTIYRSETYAG